MFEKLKLYSLQIKIVLGTVAVIAIVFFVNDYLDTKNLLKRQAAMTSTLSAQFEQVGKAFISTNEIIKNNQEATNKATAMLGDQMVKYMASNNAQLQSLHQSIGGVTSSVMELTKIVGGFRDKDGVVKDVKLTQDRPNNAPPLTILTLNYDPSKPLGAAFNGSKWSNNKEVFTHSLGEWKLKDGGYRTTARMTRVVYDAEGKKIGEEEIPLEKAESEFTPSAFQLGPEIPRFTISPMIGYDVVDRKYVPGLLGEYRITNKMDVKAGIIGSTTMVGVGFKFNIKP